VSENEPWILLTNDDGVDSPALVPLLRQLATVAPVRAVVPAGECSWTGKILSRFSQLELRQVEREGHQIWTLDGYPADCANIGMHSLGDDPPALVVSGINVGANAGLAYFLSSGTIGAAVESMLGGAVAAAFSLQLAAADYQRWRRSRDLSCMEETWEEAAVVTREIVEEILAGGLPQGASLLSVNMPPKVTAQSPRCFAGVTPTGYGRYFARDEVSGLFSYSSPGLRVTGEDADRDIAVLARGAVALTPIRFALDVEATAADCRRFERGS
jgi:5'-nucleotidase